MLFHLPASGEDPRTSQGPGTGKVPACRKFSFCSIILFLSLRNSDAKYPAAGLASRRCAASVHAAYRRISPPKLCVPRFPVVCSCSQPGGHSAFMGRSLPMNERPWAFTTRLSSVALRPIVSNGLPLHLCRSPPPPMPAPAGRPPGGRCSIEPPPPFRVKSPGRAAAHPGEQESPP